jgi:signal transduction histidine kinase
MVSQADLTEELIVKNNSYLRLQVADNGPGFEQELAYLL